MRLNCTRQRRSCNSKLISIENLWPLGPHTKARLTRPGRLGPDKNSQPHFETSTLSSLSIPPRPSKSRPIGRPRSNSERAVWLASVILPASEHQPSLLDHVGIRDNKRRLLENPLRFWKIRCQQTRFHCCVRRQLSMLDPIHLILFFPLVMASPSRSARRCQIWSFQADVVAPSQSCSKTSDAA